LKLTTLLACLGLALPAAPALAQEEIQIGRPGASLIGLTDAEKLEKSAEHLAHMKTAMKQALARVEEARNEKDVVKLNCVNEKLTQIKGMLKVAEQADIALHEAISNKDPGADAEFAKIGIARTKADALRSETDQCIGQLAYIVDEKTTIEVQQPSDLPDRDYGLRRGRIAGSSWSSWNAGPYGGIPAPGVSRPPPASRYR
jgi:hypothetical protein